MSLKPQRQLSSIIFTKSGKVYPSREDLPRGQKELEAVMAEKFVGALKKFHSLNLSNIKLREDNADFTCEKTNGRIIEVQVREVVDQFSNRLRIMRETYSQAINESFALIFPELNGFRLDIVDSGMEPFLPSLKTKIGKTHLGQIFNNIAELANGIGTLERGKMRTKTWLIGKNNIRICCMCKHSNEKHQQTAGSVYWSGGRVFSPNEQMLPLVSAIFSKARMYPNSTEEFWLLLYSSDYPISKDDPEVRRAIDLLNEMEHPFRQVWFLFPYDNHNYGHVFRIFP